MEVVAVVKDRERIEDSGSGSVLLTGATGFVGTELLARFLERTDRHVFALVRGADDRAAATRMERTLRSLFGTGHPYAKRVTAVRGDITRPGLGLRGDGDGLARQVSEIVHGAASVSLGLELKASRAINAQGTRRVIEFAGAARRTVACGASPTFPPPMSPAPGR